MYWFEGNTFNVFEDGWGLDLDNYPYYMILADEPKIKATTFNVQHNTFNLNQSDYGMLLRDELSMLHPGEPTVSYNLKSNKFKLSDKSCTSTFTNFSTKCCNSQQQVYRA